MTIRDRLTGMINGFRSPDVLRATPSRTQESMSPKLIWPSSLLGKPSWDMVDVESYIQYGFSLNAIIYGAIMYKVRALSSAPLRAYSGQKDSPTPLPDNNPLAMLVTQPNPAQDYLQFHSWITMFLNLSGNVYLFLARDRASQLPYAIYPLRSNCVKIIPSVERDRPVLGYMYVPEGGSYNEMFPILPEDIIHIKLPNPNDPLNGAGYGMSPLSSVAQSANVDNEITKFLKVFFEKGAMFQNVVSFDVAMQPKDIAKAREAFEQIYGGVENWSKFAILDNGAKLQRVTPTFDEMGFETIDARNETRMLGPFGVPPILISARVGLERSTFSNYEEARKACWEDTLLPELRLGESAFQKKLTFGNTWVKYDLSDIPALRRDILPLTTAALNLIKGGVPPRIAFGTVGLEVEQYPGDDQPYRAPTPLQVNPPNPEDDTQEDVEPDTDEEQRSHAAPQFKILKWPYDAKAMATKVDNIAVSWEERFGNEANRQFKEELRTLLAFTSEAQRAALHRKATISWNALASTVLEWYQSTRPEAWRNAFVPLLEGVMLDAGREWANTLGITWDVRNLRGEVWFQNYTLKFAQPITDTSSKAVQDVIAQGQAEGWTIPQFQTHLETLFDQWMKGNLSPQDFEWFEQRLPPYRRELIARTETMRSANAGTLELGKEWGVQRKAWLNTDDDRTRETHIQAGLDYGESGNPGPIPIDSEFIIGGASMNAPGDPSAPVEEIANCRCTLLLLKD